MMRSGSFAVACLALAACAGTPPPTQELSAAQASITDAERAGAVQYASLDLNDARQKLAGAQNAVNDKRYDEAKRLAEEADIDARLASAKAQAVQAQQATTAPAPVLMPRTQ